VFTPKYDNKKSLFVVGVIENIKMHGGRKAFGSSVSNKVMYVYICIHVRESNGKQPLRTCPGCSVPEPYQSPDGALVSAQTGPRAEYL